MFQRPVVGMGAACGLAAAMQTTGYDNKAKEENLLMSWYDLFHDT